MPWRGFQKYRWGAFGGDVAGGFVAALIALPYGVALASLMGLPPLLGVLTSIIAAPVCALFGRNPVLIGGVSAVTIPFIASAVAQQGITAKSFAAGTIFSVKMNPLRDGNNFGSRVGAIAKCPAQKVPSAGKHCDSVEGSEILGGNSF